MTAAGSEQTTPDRPPAPWLRRRRLIALLVALSAIVTGALATAQTTLATGPSGAPAAADARLAAPKVAIIVGPTGALTEGFRKVAARTAATARAEGAAVVTAYSPNATWPVVRQALEGASVVVYLGHGNGWPSRYTKSLNPETQDGLGLNPVAGVDDVAHRYFGEKYLARDVHLATNAIVILRGTCYAAGNSEPGLPETGLDVAKQRADNFAAGWLRAGAAAVVADIFGNPSYYISAIMERNRSIESIWRSSPTFHNHVVPFSSVRTPGMAAMLDPTHPRSSFYRSIVGRLSTTGEDVVAGVPGTEVGDAIVTPAHSGPAVETLRLGGPAVTGGKVPLVMHLTATKGTVSPEELRVDVGWVPADLVVAAVAGADPRAAQQRVTPAVSSFALRTDLGRFGDQRDSLTFDIEVPRDPGSYHLVVTMLDASGVPFDDVTQQAIPTLVVQVTSPARSTVEPGSNRRIR